MGRDASTAAAPRHEGGFALWPSKFTNYSVEQSAWFKKQPVGKGDVLRQFADAANRWGIGICYYLNVQDDGYVPTSQSLSVVCF